MIESFNAFEALLTASNAWNFPNRKWQKKLLVEMYKNYWLKCIFKRSRRFQTAL